MSVDVDVPDGYSPLSVRHASALLALTYYGLPSPNTARANFRNITTTPITPSSSITFTFAFFKAT